MTTLTIRGQSAVNPMQSEKFHLTWDSTQAPWEQNPVFVHDRCFQWKAAKFPLSAAVLTDRHKPILQFSSCRQRLNRKRFFFSFFLKKAVFLSWFWFCSKQQAKVSRGWATVPDQRRASTPVAVTTPTSLSWRRLFASIEHLSCAFQQTICCCACQTQTQSPDQQQKIYYFFAQLEPERKVAFLF